VFLPQKLHSLKVQKHEILRLVFKFLTTIFLIIVKILRQIRIFVNTALLPNTHQFFSLRVFGEKFHSAYSPKTRNSTTLNTLYAENAVFFRVLARNDYFNFALSPKRRVSHFRQKRSIRSEDEQLRRQRLVSLRIFGDSAHVMLRVFGENGELSKISHIRANLKTIFENVGYTVLCIY
jgi:hypothetical protein